MTPTPRRSSSRRGSSGRSDAPEHCVICFFQEVITKLARQKRLTRIATQKSEMGAHPVYEMAFEGRRLAVFHPGVVRAAGRRAVGRNHPLGCRKFIACGGAGVLDREIAVGHIVVPTSAVRDEGTSYHYLPPGREVMRQPGRRRGHRADAAGARRAVRAGQDLDHRRHLSGDAGQGADAQGRGLPDRRDGGGRLLRRGAVPRRDPSPRCSTAATMSAATSGMIARWSKRISIRERLFWLAAEACLLL